MRNAAAVGVQHVITSEGDPKTAFGHNLTDKEALFLIRERLYEPLRVAEDHGVKILLEPHGKYTDSIDHMEKILELCDSPALGVNFDSGNSWLGGTDPVAMVKRLAPSDPPRALEGLGHRDGSRSAARCSVPACPAPRSAPAASTSWASTMPSSMPAMMATAPWRSPATPPCTRATNS